MPSGAITIVILGLGSQDFTCLIRCIYLLCIYDTDFGVRTVNSVESLLHNRFVLKLITFKLTYHDNYYSS